VRTASNEVRIHKMQNLIYLGYYLINTNYRDVAISWRCARGLCSSDWRLAVDVVACAIKYGTSFSDYFNFRFFAKTAPERAEYASMAFMYEFHRALNDQHLVSQVDNKVHFAERFANYSRRPFVYRKHELTAMRAFIAGKTGSKLVLKDPQGTAGAGVRILEITGGREHVLVNNVPLSDFLASHFVDHDILYLEEFIVQHAVIDAVSPSAINTIRIITLVTEQHAVEILGAIFRISINCPVDNFSQGNLAAEIDPESGTVVTGGIRKRAACDHYHDRHPVTGATIRGLKVPFWPEILTLVREAAMVLPGVRSVGWDIAVTANGPFIIEGNSKWNKDTWQIPAGYGKKRLIERYIR
jgi:hypothetical protein